MVKTSMQVEGLEALRKALRTLPIELQKKPLSDCVAAGARVIRKEAVSIVRKDTGLLARSIYATRGVRALTEAAAFVAVKKLSGKKIAAFKKATGLPAEKNPNDPYYWYILEHGKSTRTAHPFLRPAFDRKKEEAVEAMKRVLRESTERIAKRLAWPKGAR